MINTLIVEDNFQYVKNILNTVIGRVEEIHITNIATTIKEAKDIINSNNIELIFLDLKLPDSTGVDLIEEIERLNLVTKPNIIIISGELTLIREIKKINDKYNFYIISKLESEEFIFNHIKQFIEQIKYLRIERQINKEITNQLSNIGYNFKYKGTHYIFEAITYIYKSNNLELLDNLEQNVYKYIAYKHKRTINNIKTNAIKATNHVQRNKSEGINLTPKAVISDILIKIINNYGN